MASWKEKGEVPDSDDEEDDDSQAVPNEGYGEDLLQEPRDTQRKHIGGHNSDEDICEDAYRGQLSADASQVVGVDPQHPQTTSKQPSLSPRVIRKPPALLDLNQLSESQEPSSQVPPHVSDEISPSYVMFSSSFSSLNSAPAQIQHLDDAAATEDQDTHSSRPADDAPIQHEPQDRQEEEDVNMLAGHGDFPSASRRSLRQRNPIQLHPYALEGEKYRRTLMARGMRPLRLAQVQEDITKLARAQSSPDLEFEVENESQPVSIEETQLSQPSQPSGSSELPALASLDRTTTESGGDDDEFPDIDQLLDRSNENFVQTGPKRRKTTYSSQYTSQLPSQPPLPRAHQGGGTSSGGVEILDIPPSPPATSSPTPVFQAPFSDRRSKYITSGLASTRATSLEYAGSEKGTRKGATTGNLPTPMTNSVKHTIDLTAELQSDEDPFASDTDSSAASPSSEMDQSMQVRRVGKKIRGVLPASWLRLDQQTRQDGNAKVTRREHQSLSPVKAALSRRGVAVPKDATYENSPKPAQSNADTHFLLSNSDSDDDSNLLGFVEESAPDLFQNCVFSQTDMGSVMEDDRIDVMLPSQKRQTKLLPGTAHRKRRPVLTSLFVQRHPGPNFQPKITDHLQKTWNSNRGSQKNIHHRIRTSGPNKQSRSIPSQRYRQTSIPKLSILDVVKPYEENRERLPAFIRIAARNARSRRGLGRHSPTRKFIKLANRADTQDARSILRDWREGTLRPCAEVPDFELLLGVRQPLGDISENIRNPAASALRTEGGPEIEASHVIAVPRKIVISRSIEPKPAPSTEPRPLTAGRNGSAILTKGPKIRVRAPKMTTSTARPAQLETSVTDYSARHPNLAFGSTKKVLDTLYRKARKGNKARGDVQLARFLGDNSPPQHADASTTTDKTQEARTSSTKKSDLVQPARRRKRVPRHVDASAAVFRQPSEPLILDFLQQLPGTQEKFGNDGKLLGLGKFGTTYTHHFDVFPLQPGVFFHEATFIGSGRLSKALEISTRCFDSDRGYSDYLLSGKQLRWGPWSGIVSSEIGMCFDWIIEQLEDSTAKLSDVDVDALIGCITHMIDYVQTCLVFPDSPSRRECVLRAVEVLCSFTKHLDVLARERALVADMLRIFVELSCRAMVFSFQILRIAQSDPTGIDLVPQLESLLQRAAVLTVSLLLSLGLAPVRSLYDDLQYLAYREAGINCDRYAAQAWVVAMHIVYVAQIPRVSFWDVVNAQLIEDDETQLSDARVLERMWYDMFSLLPLTDFDINGVLVPRARLLRSFENWALPQRIVKKVFELYNSKSRQSPSFNDYCRALFSRCSHLMQTWDWRRHGIIVGTLFDFFATRKLAHLRNEEVYKSPSFLEELDEDPALAVDPEDRCFHILLKIIAISIKQMREAGDTKGIRNLVTRVLPNHDRQYPKEKTVHQRDLASLRNHHDLLCTLFWAAPPDLRPSIALIRELVNPESSHHEAYLINLRSWENLTRFILAFTPTPTAYLPLATWQSESFTQLLAQYQSAEKDIKDQLRQLSAAAKQLITQHTIATTIEENQKQIIMALQQNLHALKRRIDKATTMDVIKLVAFDANCIKSLTNAMSMFRHRHKDDWPVVETALDIIIASVTRLIDSALVSEVLVQNSSEDSQEYGSDLFSDVEVEMLEYIGALNGELLSGVRDILRTALRSGVTVKPSFMEKIVDTWALMAGTLILAKTYDLSDFLSESGPLNELDMDNATYNVRQYAPYFLGKLATVIGDHLLLDTTDRDLLSDWLCILIKPHACFHFEHKLLPFFAKCENVVDLAAESWSRHQIGNKRSTFSLNGIKSRRIDLIRDTFQIMDVVLRNEPSKRGRYQIIVRKILTHMKSDLGAMNPRSQEFIQYQEFVRLVHSHLTTFFRNLSTSELSDEFFSTNSTYPAHHGSHNDTRIFVATIRNYSLRLHTVRGKNELNHYVLAVLKHAAVIGNLDEISESLQEAMGNEQETWAQLSHYVLTVLSPSFIHAAFVSEQGWMLAEPMLEAAQEHLMDIADSNSHGALKGVSEIMSMIVNGISILMEAHSPDNIRAATSHELVYVLLMSSRFMVLSFDWLPFTMGLCSEQETQISKISALLAFFYHFACGAKAYLCSPLKYFVKSLQRYEPSEGGFDDRELLVELYEEATNGEYTKEVQEQALEALAAPFVRNDTELDQMRIQLKQLHPQKFMACVWLFHDMRESAFFAEAKRALKDGLIMEIPHFSTVILADYRQNWAGCPDSGDMEIKFGHEKRVATGLTAHGKHRKHYFEALQKALGDYITRYEKVFGHRSDLPIVKHSRRQAINATGNMTF